MTLFRDFLPQKKISFETALFFKEPITNNLEDVTLHHSKNIDHQLARSIMIWLIHFLLIFPSGKLKWSNCLLPLICN